MKNASPCVLVLHNIVLAIAYSTLGTGTELFRYCSSTAVLLFR